jgi:peroxiredoxin
MVVEVGSKAPDFELPDTDLNKRKLSEIISKGKYVVLAFFPGAFTSVCTKEMCTFRDSISNFEKLDAEVIGISVDSPFVLKAFKEQYKLNFTLLSDFNKEVIEKYGVVLSSLAGLLKGVAKRAVFIIAPDGTVKYKWVSDDPKVEPNYEELRKTLEKIKKG